MQQEENNSKRMKVKKGWLSVQVGLAEEEEDIPRRFLIPISYLRHPLVVRLLDAAHDLYGYHSDGPLRLPISVDDFLHLRWLIHKDSHHHHHHHNHHHHLSPLPHPLSFHSCS